MPAVWAMVWKLLQWPLVFLLVSTAVGLIYYFAPDAEQDGRAITPGSLLAATLLAGRRRSAAASTWSISATTTPPTARSVASSCCCSWFYPRRPGDCDGAEMNAEIEHAWPGAKRRARRCPVRRRRSDARQRARTESADQLDQLRMGPHPHSRDLRALRTALRSESAPCSVSSFYFFLYPSTVSPLFWRSQKTFVTCTACGASGGRGARA